MFEAILFDLDGTLLDIDMNFFIPKYFEKMIIMAEEFGINEAKKMTEQIFKSTNVMIANANPTLTNEEVFMQDFLDNFNHLTNDQAIKFFDYFYSHGFPKLSHHSKPFLGIPQMMQKVFDRGHKVVVATNSVFPRTAILERLKWAGVDGFDYQLITTYEVMHFCKPHPEYYEEITDAIGVNPKNCLMVGNDIGEDLAAGKIGMQTFLVEDRLIDKGIDLKPDYHGKLADLYKFLDQI